MISPEREDNLRLKGADNENSFKLVAYNIYNFKKKYNNIDLISFLKQYDIFFLFETFIKEENDFINLKKIYSDYELKCMPAYKKSHMGRASEGSVIGVKKWLLKEKIVKFVNLSQVETLEMKNKEMVYYILPVYLNCDEWQGGFRALQGLIEKYRHFNFILIGDFNARIGTQQVIPHHLNMLNKNLETIRKSKDSKVNSNGRAILEFFEDNNMIILNGRSKNDKQGDFTFIGPMGSSVIDLCTVSADILSCISTFEVALKTFSDHLPLTLKCYIKVNKKNEIMPLLPKFKWVSADKDVYKAVIENSTNEQIWSENDPSGNLKCIINMIINYNEKNKRKSNYKKFLPKQEWFDVECHRMRTKVFNLLRCYRNSNSPVIKTLYHEANKNYERLCDLKREKYLEDTIEKLKTIRDAKDFWKQVRIFKTKKMFNQDKDISAEDWVVYFRNLTNPNLASYRISYADPYIEDSVLDSPFDMSDLRLVVLTAKDNKAPGSDRIPYEFFKSAPENFLNKLLDIFNGFYNKGKVPDSFKDAIIFPLHKRGELSDVANYRGISFCNSVGKIFTGLLLGKLSRWSEQNEIMGEFQAGFRKGYSTIDNVSNLMHTVKIKLSKKRNKVFAFFVDLSAAFDRIDRHALLYKLSEMGVSSKMKNIIKNLYTGTYASVWCCDGLSEAFETTMGVKQGCLLSPILFSLFLNDLEDCLNGGVQINKTVIKLLAYADDLVLLATNKNDLQEMVDQLDEYCKKWNLVVNLNKSKIVVFRNGGRPAKHEVWNYRGENIEVVNSYKYLGITLTSGLSMEKHLEEKVSKAKFALNSFNNLLNKKNVPFSSKLHIFFAVSRAILCYGAQVWGSRMFGKVELPFKYFFKKIFNLPKFTPDFFVYLESDVHPTFLYTLKLHLKYILRCLNLPDNRYPAILVREIIKRKLFWYSDWGAITESYSVSLDDLFERKITVEEVLDTIKNKLYNDFISVAQNSTRQNLYRELDLSFKIVNSQYDSQTIAWILKIRGELLYLNKYSYRNDIGFCSLCNMNVDEDVYHFICECPIFRNFRLLYLENEFLILENVMLYLNGNANINKLIKYCRSAWNYRHFLITKFNY